MSAVEDMYVRHQIDLSRFAGSFAGEMSTLLKRTHTSIANALLTQEQTPFQRQRLLQFAGTIQSMLEVGYAETLGLATKEMRGLAVHEAAWNQEALAAASGKNAVRVSAGAVYVAATAKPFQGAAMGTWYQNLARDEQRLLINTVQQGFVLGQTNQEIANALKPAFRRAENNVNTIARSSVQHYASATRSATMRANSGLVNGYFWTSTLDGRVTLEICVPRDGRQYSEMDEPIDHGYPALGGPGNAHWNCRSTAVPNIRGVDQSEDQRPGFDYNQESKTKARSTVRRDSGTGKVVEKGARNPTAKRMGQPVQTSDKFGNWFGKQPKWFQKDYLGPERFDMYDSGTLSLKSFSTKEGSPLSLIDLKQRFPSVS
jgi:hypothetical protein